MLGTHEHRRGPHPGVPARGPHFLTLGQFRGPLTPLPSTISLETAGMAAWRRSLRFRGPSWHVLGWERVDNAQATWTGTRAPPVCVAESRRTQRLPPPGLQDATGHPSIHSAPRDTPGVYYRLSSERSARGTAGTTRSHCSGIPTMTEMLSPRCPIQWSWSPHGHQAVGMWPEG